MSRLCASEVVRLLVNGDVAAIEDEVIDFFSRIPAGRARRRIHALDWMLCLVS